MATPDPGSTIEKFKKEAAQYAAELVENGMIVGLGSGTTAELVVDAIGQRVKAGLQLIGVPTSEKTAEQSRRLNIPITTLEEKPRIDLALDGADEVELKTLSLIKGGGGNLLREKIVAVASSRFVIVVDDRKPTRKLGTHWPVPVEVVPFGWESTEIRLKEAGATPKLRLQANGKAYITDGGHYILDCAFGPIPDAAALATKLDGIVGVVEHGLFIGMASQVIVAGAQGVNLLKREDLS